MDVLFSGPSLAVASAVFWAFAVILFKVTGDEIPPLALNLFKNLVALVFFVPLIAIVGETFTPTFTGREWAAIVGSGLIGITLADTIFFAALRRLGAGLNAVVDCFYVPSMIFMGVFFLGEKITALAVVGAILAAGAILIGAASRPVEGRTRRDVTVGFGLGVVGMILLAICVVIVKPTLTANLHHAVWITTARLVAGLLPLIPVVLLGRERADFLRVLRPSPLWKRAVPASILGGTLAMAAWLGGFARIDMSAAAILNQLSTIFIFLLAALVLHEPLTLRRVIAVGMAFAGAALSLVKL